MNDEQQIEVERLLPMIDRLARRYDRRAKDGEAYGVAHLALCQAVEKYDPDKGLTVDSWSSLHVRNELNRSHRKETRLREIGLSGGAPSGRDVGATSTHRRSLGHDPDGGHYGEHHSSSDMDNNFAATESSSRGLMEFLELLPVRLQQIAIARWRDGDELAKIAEDEELTVDQVRYRITEAEKFARVYALGIL